MQNNDALTGAANQVMQFLSLPDHERWLVDLVLGKPAEPLVFQSFSDAEKALAAARQLRSTVERVEAILSVLVDLANTFDDAWTARRLAGRDSINGLRAFNRAVALATTQEQVRIVYNNCDRHSPSTLVVIRRVAELLSVPLPTTE